METITVLGAGYVGLTTAALLSNANFKVYIVEVNPLRLKSIKKGKSFFYEEGLNNLIKSSMRNKTLIPTSSYQDAVPKSDVVFSCVGTPDNPDGSSNLSYIYSAANEAADYLKEDSIYVQKSTVPVGTGLEIQNIFSNKNKNISYISNPEFLKEGTAIADTLFFDRVVVGGRDKAAINKILDIYRQLEKYRNKVVKIADIRYIERKGEYISTGLNSAELIKVSANAFLALKISYANSIAIFADKVGANIVEVMDAVGADERIGRAFLNAGRGYGGGCFPKDVSSLISSCKAYKVDSSIMESAQSVNSSMPSYIVKKMTEKLNNSITNKKIAVLGLSFKSGTSDVRKSPGIKIANIISKAGAIVTAYDPQANEEAKSDLRGDVVLHDTIDDTINGTEAIIIATEWPEFINLPISEYAKASNTKGSIFVDAVNRFTYEEVTNQDFVYIGVGR